MDIEEKANFSSRFQCAPLIRLLQSLVSSIKQRSTASSPSTPVSRTSVVLHDCLCYTKAVDIPSPKSLDLSQRSREVPLPRELYAEINVLKIFLYLTSFKDQYLDLLKRVHYLPHKGQKEIQMIGED